MYLSMIAEINVFSVSDIGVARILSGVHFLPKKLTIFLVVASKTV